MKQPRIVFLSFAAIAFALLASGCASLPAERGVVSSPESFSVPPGSAKVVITRNTDALYMGAKARVTINGEMVAELWRGESYAGAFAPGKQVISVDAWGASKRTVVQLLAAVDTEYTLEIAPNGENLGSGALSAGLFGVVGALVHDDTRETGPFLIVLKRTKPLR